MPYVTRCLALLGALLILAACTRERNRWPEAEPAPAPATAVAEPEQPPLVSDKRIVLFAPLDPGPLAEFYPEARLELPHEMALRVDLLMKGHDGRVGEQLPDSFAPRWEEGRVPATAGTHVVVLSRVVELSRIKGSVGTTGTPDRIEATVELRLLDVDGKAIYHKRAIGSAIVSASPKLSGSGAKPESRAAWDALDSGLANIRTFLAAQNELASTPTPATTIDPATIALVEVVFDAAPAGAEIHIDNAFRGHAPLTLRLPPRELNMRILLAGYETWERTLKPEPGMKIQPVLRPTAVPMAEPAPAAAPAAEPPAPAAEPQPAVPAVEPAAAGDDEPVG